MFNYEKLRVWYFLQPSINSMSQTLNLGVGLPNIENLAKYLQASEVPN